MTRHDRRSADVALYAFVLYAFMLSSVSAPSPDLHPLLQRLGALNDPVRLRILRLLDREELSVGELARALQLPQSTVSRHLKLLHEGGWAVATTHMVEAPAGSGADWESLWASLTFAVPGR